MREIARNISLAAGRYLHLPQLAPLHELGLGRVDRLLLECDPSREAAEYPFLSSPISVIVRELMTCGVSSIQFAVAVYSANGMSEPGVSTVILYHRRVPSPRKEVSW